MKNILEPQHRDVLARVAAADVLVALDYDGTLAPIVAVPEAARMRASTRDLLEQVTKLYPCIVISGRARDDVRERLDGVGVLEVLGNHGAEPWPGSDRVLELVRCWRALLAGLPDEAWGIAIEDKRYSLAIHYRRARDRKKARAAILAAAAQFPEARVIGGKQVVNLVPQGAPNKGMALVREKGRLRCDAAVYVGDDETDEDAFALGQGGRMLGIRVGPSQTSRAQYCIRDQTQIEALLKALIELRRERLT